MKFILALLVAVILPVTAFSADTSNSEDSGVSYLLAEIQNIALGKLDRSIEKRLTRLIDKVEWQESQSALKEALAMVKAGKGEDINFSAITETVMLDAVRDTVSKNMGSAEAAAVNSAITALVKEGVDGALDSMQATVNGLIDKYGKGEESQAALKKAVSQLRSGKVKDIDWKNLSQTMALDSLCSVIDKNMGKTEAGYLKDAIREYVKNGKEGLSQSALNSINDQINRYIKGEDAQNAMKAAVSSIFDGKISDVDFIDLGSKVAVGGISDWIDRQDWSQEEKDNAKKALNGFAEDGIDGLTEAGKEILKEKLTEKIGAEKAAALIGEAENFFGGKEVDWGTVANAAVSIVASNLQRAISKQLDKLAEKYPALAGVFEALKKGVANAFAILCDKDMSLKDKITALTKLAKELLKELCNELKKFVMEKLQALLQVFTDLAKKLIDMINEIIKTLKELFVEIKSKINEFVKNLNSLIKSLKDTVTKVKEEFMEFKEQVKDAQGKLEKIIDRIPKRQVSPPLNEAK